MLQLNVRLYKLVAISLLALVSSCQKKRYHSEQSLVKLDTVPEVLHSVYRWQKDKNAYFLDPKKSPLRPKEKKVFKRLSFFTPDTAYQVRAAFYANRSPDTLYLKTNTGDKSAEVVYGNLYFNLKGEPFELPVYRAVDASDDYLFLPFSDQTNGVSSYGGGRYIDLTYPLADTITLDFNKAYNPYCAYNPKYSCPLVPPQNFLDTEIFAGERAFELFQK